MGNMCKAKMADMTQLTQVKDLFCKQGLEAVKKDPANATKLLKEATDVLKKSGSPHAQSLAELAEKPVEKFEEIKALLSKIPA